MPVRVYTIPFASATVATSVNKVFVGPHFKSFLCVSNVTGFNAAAGNTTIQVRHGSDDVNTHVLMTSVATETVKGVYELTNTGLHYMSVGFGTACTGSAANQNIDIVVYSYDL